MPFQDCNLSGHPSAGLSPKKMILSLGIPALAAALSAVGYKDGRVQIAFALLSFNWNVNSSTVYACFGCNEIKLAFGDSYFTLSMIK